MLIYWCLTSRNDPNNHHWAILNYDYPLFSLVNKPISNPIINHESPMFHQVFFATSCTNNGETTPLLRPQLAYFGDSASCLAVAIIPILPRICQAAGGPQSQSHGEDAKLLGPLLQSRVIIRIMRRYLWLDVEPFGSRLQIDKTKQKSSVDHGCVCILETIFRCHGNPVKKKMAKRPTPLFAW